MALDTFTLGPNPKWYFVNNNGKPLSGGLFNTWSSLDNSLRKNVYTTPSLDFPLPNPATIDANGTLGPFWFAFDSTNPNDGYFIEVTDALGQVIWTVDPYFAAGGSGGSTTTVINIDNLINNDVMWRHITSATDILSPVPTFTVIAPSNHANLVPNANITGASIVNSAAPDITFIKNNQSGTDQISFPLFSPLGTQPISGEFSPVDYFNYTCTIAGTETTKVLQFPVTAKVQNLSNQAVIGTFWAKSATSNTLTLSWFQFFGDGAGASSPVTTLINSFNLTPTWQKFNFSSTVPDVDTKTLGAPNQQGPNDALFIRFGFPVSAASNIDLTNLKMYLGTAIPNPDLGFQNYDEIDSIIAIPRTGDVRLSMNSFVPYGWVPCNDGVLSNGDIAIVPPALTISPVSRNNIDTYPLYYLIWNLTFGYPQTIQDQFAPIYTSAGVLTTRGTDAITDFAAGKQLRLTRMLGRVLAGTNPTLIASKTYSPSTVTSQLTVTDASQFPTGTPVLLTNVGGSLPTFSRTNNPPIYYSIYIDATNIKLASSVDLAQAGTALTITGAGVGTQTVQSAVGTFTGAGLYTLLANDLPAHTHVAPGGQQFMTSGGGGANVGAGILGSALFGVTGNNITANNPFSLIQPTAFVNVMLKL